MQIVKSKSIERRCENMRDYPGEIFEISGYNQCRYVWLRNGHNPLKLELLELVINEDSVPRFSIQTETSGILSRPVVNTFGQFVI